MNSIADVKSAPIPYDADRAAEVVVLYSGLPENVLRLIEGTAGCSPYLHASLTREVDWVKENLNKELHNIVKSEINTVHGITFTELATKLRITKRRVALLAALADLGGLWTLEDVTGALTDLADSAVQTALTYLVGEEIRRGKLPGCTEDDLHDCAGLVALAMGKMGAWELNYSSDIDLIMLFDETRHNPDNYAVVRASFIRVTQRMVKMLSENTADGYVFRTDLRLRPDASVTPVCMAMEPAENYYESLGRTWERAAFIKARPCAGDLDAGWAFLDRLKPFIWRKYLDFAAIQDAHDMRLRIRDHKGLHGEINIAGHDMKLGQGGIREIEFYTQTRQIICGGRDPKIRQSQTLLALAEIANKGWIDKKVADDLSNAYREHRLIEHRLQMLDDAQTHQYPSEIGKRQRMAAFCGATDIDAFEGNIEKRLRHVNSLTEKLFATENRSQSRAVVLSETANSIVEKWQALPALRSERARQIFSRLKPEILERFSKQPSDEPLIHFDGFLRGQPAGIQIFSLFEANPQLLDLLIDICAIAPALARYLAQNSQVLDAVVSLDFFQTLPDLQNLNIELTAQLATLDYEQILDTTRRWVKEKQFRVGVHMLRQLSTPEDAARDYSNIAEAALQVLFPIVGANFSRRYGPAPGRGAVVLAMGRLGSREMTATSDLDLIVIYDSESVDYSDGPKSLDAKTYFARLTKAILSALTVPTAEGSLFDVDMRLRPSGRQGPVATSLKSFSSYQCNDAWTWEHLALLRGRVIVGNPTLASDVEDAIQTALTGPRDPVKTIADIADMRSRLFDAKGNTDTWNVKDGAGRLVDIELLCQVGALLCRITEPNSPVSVASILAKKGWLTTSEAMEINNAYHLYSRVQHISRLAVEGKFSRNSITPDLGKLLCDVTQVTDLSGLEQKLINTAIILTKITNKKLGE